MADSYEKIIAEMLDAAKDGDDPGFHVGETIFRWATRLRSLSGGVCDCVASRCLHEKTCASLTAPKPQPGEGDWFADTLAAAGEVIPLDAELPGMWERADLIGGATDATPDAGELRIGQTRHYASHHGDEWFREMIVGGVTFLAPLEQQDEARHALAARLGREG